MKQFEEFQEFRKILCLCPGCGEIVRVSDLKLKVKSRKPANTWLDEYENKLQKMMLKEDKFAEKESSLREKAVVKGRKEAEKVFNNSISQKIKKLKLSPHDIEALMHPVDYVAFKGMTANDDVSEVMMLSQTIKNKNLQTLRDQVKKAIQKKNYSWEVARINEKGKITMEK